jgi:hypothetical protein
VSCVASEDVVSDSAKFSMTSRKEGIDPVVIAFIRGIVIVGDVACAVNGIAEPSEIKLCAGQRGALFWLHSQGEIPLRICEARTFRKNKVTTTVSKSWLFDMS